MLIPNFVEQVQTAAPLILAAIAVALFLLAIESWPDKPKWRR